MQEDCGVFWVCQDGKANRFAILASDWLPVTILASHWSINNMSPVSRDLGSVLMGDIYILCCLDPVFTGDQYFLNFRYECPPGLAYDQQSRGCRWADQVRHLYNTGL